MKETKKETKRPKIGLALGGGSAKGLAHIGVIRTLEKNNIPIDFIAGTSIGAMVGGFYAAGLDTEKIEKIAEEIDEQKIFSFLDPNLKGSLIKGEKIEKFIESHIDGKKFKDCRIPFSAIATDFKKGEAVVLNEGKMTTAIRASISIPLVFKPVEIGGKTLVDGGLSVPVPAEIVKNMGADLVIAVNLSKYYRDDDQASGWYNTADDSIDILNHHLAFFCAKEADIVIEMDLDMNWYDFTKVQDRILAGEKATQKILPQLKNLIRERSKSKLRKLLEFFEIIPKG